MSVRAERKQDLPQRVQFNCACGEHWSQNMKHYEIVKCKCDMFHWVLQPHADGPFKSFPWPGTPAMHKWREEVAIE